MNNTVTYLGCKNSWRTEDWETKQPLLDKCVEAGHQMEREQRFNCYNVYTCSKCGIQFAVDSSD